MATNRQGLPGHIFCSSVWDNRPVIRSGQVSNVHSGVIVDLEVDAAAAAITLGFSNATLSRSIGSSMGRISCASLASMVQSRPPEKRTATFDL